MGRNTQHGKTTVCPLCSGGACPVSLHSRLKAKIELCSVSTGFLATRQDSGNHCALNCPDLEQHGLQPYQEGCVRLSDENHCFFTRRLFFFFF